MHALTAPTSIRASSSFGCHSQRNTSYHQASVAKTLTQDDGSALDPAVMAANRLALHARVLRFLRTFSICV